MPSTNDNPAPKLAVVDVPGAGQVQVVASVGFPVNVWFRIKELCGDSIVSGTDGPGQIIIPWTNAFRTLPQIAKLRAAFTFVIELDATVSDKFRKFQLERKAVATARSSTDTRQLTDEQIDVALHAVGFIRRELKDFQKRDVAKLVAIPNGANFSVPGAGKTTVALAVHALIRKPDTVLLVVCPKNAFGAWEETLEDCIPSDAPHNLGQHFVRLDEDAETLTDELLSARLKFLITYERFARNVDFITTVLSRRSIHLVLDESHRIKAGYFSQRGEAILSVAGLPIRRDILSGTPIPHDISDLTSQLEFLWPGQSISQTLEESPRPGAALRNLYVRTTKSQLGLEPPRRKFISVPMGPFHAALYGILRDETLQQIANIRHSQVDIISARRSVMRLLQSSVMPLATVFKIVGANESTAVSNLIDGLAAEGDSTKLLTACEMIRSCVTGGRKIVVWTIFTDTILRLEKLLVDIRPLTLYGATPTGDNEDEDTREGKIRLFHDSAAHNVLIANPAACSEGISLHKVCHDALYVDRSYNAAHYLQSVDRIHRIGLNPGVETRISVLQTIAPQGIGSIDFSVSRRLLQKMETMNSILDDEDIRAMALDEESALNPTEEGVNTDDLVDLLEQLSTGKPPTEDEQI